MGNAPRSPSYRRSGLTLLEVMLALAILGGALATIGELMRIGARNAEIARDKTTVQLLAESTMAELEIGFLPLQAQGQAPVADVEYQDDWLFSVDVQPIDDAALVAVQVLVEQSPEIYSRPVSFKLTRWLIDETLLTTTTSTETGG
ncbi:MAG: type II secretion system protein GspI [Planctomycetaceae bacterium]|nr:type II secretion system protein GspI [Planctomycetaceae bacterium]